MTDRTSNPRRGPTLKPCTIVAATRIRQADRLRGAAHPVANIRTSEHHILSRPRLSVRMFGSWGKKRANASVEAGEQLVALAEPEPLTLANRTTKSFTLSIGMLVLRESYR
jgi:hypothetical protein